VSDAFDHSGANRVSVRATESREKSLPERLTMEKLHHNGVMLSIELRRPGERHAIDVVDRDDIGMARASKSLGVRQSIALLQVVRANDLYCDLPVELEVARPEDAAEEPAAQRLRILDYESMLLHGGTFSVARLSTQIEVGHFWNPAFRIAVAGTRGGINHPRTRRRFDTLRHSILTHQR
jgi:hypothetical protein